MLVHDVMKDRCSLMRTRSASNAQSTSTFDHQIHANNNVIEHIKQSYRFIALSAGLQQALSILQVYDNSPWSSSLPNTSPRKDAEVTITNSAQEVATLVGKRLNHQSHRRIGTTVIL